MGNNQVDRAVSYLQQGKFIILTDDSNRENEGDLVIAAEFADAAAINFMAHHARGIICLSLDEKYFDKMNIPMQPRRNTDELNANFGVSIEARTGVTTGVSAADRARTIAVVLDEDTSSHDIATPGHVFPLRANPAGVLVRPGHTEGSVDLLTIAGLKPAAVICEIMNQDGSMAMGNDLKSFSDRHGIPIISLQEVIDYRNQHENHAELVTQTKLATSSYGQLSVRVFRDEVSGDHALAIYKEAKLDKLNPVVRIHSSCVTGDLLTSLRCDCGSQLDQALNHVKHHGGLVIYLEQEGRGIGLVNKIKAYSLQDGGLDTVDANLALGLPVDARNYRIAAHILKHFGITRLQLLTNNPAKLEALTRLNIAATRLPIEVCPAPEAVNYLLAKKERLNHVLNLTGEAE